MGKILGRHLDYLQLDKKGRVVVDPYLNVPRRKEIFVIGDLAHCKQNGGKPLPGLAAVAMQQGRYVSRLIQARMQHRSCEPFKYQDKGLLAVIGRNAAVADFHFLRLNGFAAWLIWILVHIRYLIGFDNRIRVMTEWAWNYLTRKRGARIMMAPIAQWTGIRTDATAKTKAPEVRESQAPGQ